MRSLSCALVAIAALALAPAAFAQQSLLQAGPWTSAHVPMYSGPSGNFGQPILQDSGPASGGGAGVGLSELGLTVQGTGTPPYANAGTGPYGSNLCDYDAPITNATGYHYICLSPNAQGGESIIAGFSGSTGGIPLQFIINGVVTPINSSGNLLPTNNSWTGTNAFTEAVTGGSSPTISVTTVDHSSFSVPGMQVISNVDYGSFGDANTTFGLVVGGGKNLDTGATTGSWQLFSARYTGFGGGDGSAFITAGQELMSPMAGSNNNSGRYFGNNPECIIPTGMTPAECTGEEIDIKTLSSPTSDRHGLRIADLGSTGSHATDDSGLSILSSGIGWTTGVEFGSQSGQFPVVAGGQLIQTAASSAVLSSVLDFSHLTGANPGILFSVFNGSLYFGGSASWPGGRLKSATGTNGPDIEYGSGFIDINTNGDTFQIARLGISSSTIDAPLTLPSALTYGGVTLSNSVTGTGSMALSVSPTLTGTLTAAAANFSGNLTAANLPPFALNINSTFNGINYAGCAASVSCTLYINGAPALGGSFGANPTVRIDRSPTGTGGISGDDTFGLEVVLNAPATDSWTENAGFFVLNNRAPIANSTESAALLAQAFKQGNVQVGATWAASFYAWDSTGVAPTSGQGLIGNEIGLAFGVPGAEVNAGTDPFVTRQILKLVCSGLSGTHCGQGESISTFFSGDVIDTGLCFGTGCNGGNGTFGVGINMTGAFSESAILFSALNQNGLGWTNTSGVYTPTSAGAQIYSDSSNNLDISNYNGTQTNFAFGSSVAVSMTSAGLSIEGGSAITSSGPGGTLGNPAFVASSVSKTCGATIVVTNGVVTSC